MFELSKTDFSKSTSALLSICLIVVIQMVDYRLCFAKYWLFTAESIENFILHYWAHTLT